MHNNQQGTLPAAPGRDLFAPRILIGIFQGLVLYVLLNAAHNRSGIATIPLLFFPLLLVTLFIPPMFIMGLQRMRGDSARDVGRRARRSGGNAWLSRRVAIRRR